MEFIFENWPDTGRGLRVAMRRLVDDGRSYQEAVDLAKRSYLHAALLKMPGSSKAKIARRCGISPSNLNYLIKKYQLM